METKPFVYFETSAFNHLCDSLAKRSAFKRSLKNLYEIPFSPYLFNEMIAANSYRIKVLADFTCKITNERILKDNIEIMKIEILTLLNKAHLNYYNDRDSSRLFNSLRNGNLPQELKTISDFLRKVKMAQLEYDREIKKTLSKMAEELGVPVEEYKSWEVMLEELENELHINKSILENLKIDPDIQFSNSVSEEEILSLDYKKLKGTSVGFQYYLALSYKNTFYSGKRNRPGLGDLIDTQHVFYAGIVDFFVTDDVKMKEILENDVPLPKAKILTSEEFIHLAEDKVNSTFI